MALALPLLIPFAEAAGITISAIATAAGLDKLSNKVEEYIEENPENAQKIFAMIMPEQGLANILKNESDDGEEVSEEELGEIETPKLTGKEKSERIKEAIRRARGEKGLPARGNYSSPDAEGSAVDIGGSVIREVEDMGIADKNLKDNYDPNKKKFNYKRFYKKKYANGGGIGSMMEPKRKSFRGGGMDMGNASNQKQSAAMGKSTSAPGPGDTGGEGGNNPSDNSNSQSRGGGGGGGNNNTPPPKVKKNIFTKSAKDLSALFNIPVQGIQSLFGNPFNRIGGFKTKIGLTKGQIENLEEDANAIGGLSGNITNTTYGSPNNMFGFHKNMDLTDFANSATFGQGNFTTDPTTGKKSFDGGNYDFKQDQFGKVGNFINAGGLTGTANKFGESLYEDQVNNPNMNYLANGGGVGSMMQRKKFNEGSNWWDTLNDSGMNIYNSMKRGGHDDATIQNQLQTLGYYDPNAAPPDSTPDTPQVVQQLGYQGGDNFSPYNPDPNRIKSVRQDPAIQSNLEAIQRNQQLNSMGIKDPFANEQDPKNSYYGDMPNFDDRPGKQSMFAKAKQGLSGIVGNVKGLMDSPIGNVISFAMNPVMGGLKGIASLVGNAMPVNERVIQENIMGNMGVVVNDIGQIVSTGDYNDPNNVMAGYNLNRMTPATFKNRIDKIMNRRAAQTDASRARIKSIREAKKQFEAAEKLKRLAVEEANLRKGRAPGGGTWKGGSPAYSYQGQGGGEYTDSQGNTDYNDPYDSGGGE